MSIHIDLLLVEFSLLIGGRLGMAGAVGVIAFVLTLILDRRHKAFVSRAGHAACPLLFSLVYWLVALDDGKMSVFFEGLPFAGLLWIVIRLGDRQRRILEALFLIILGFGAASQVKSGLETHDYYVERAAKQAELGMEADPVPGSWSCIRENENHFLTRQTFRSTSVQTAAVAIAAMGMTMIIISGGIDLSVGSVIALTSVMMAWCLKHDWDPLPAALAGVLLGAACGLCNAAMITRLKVVPFIATLGMWGIARGLAKGIADEQKIDAPAYWLDKVLKSTPEPAWLILSPGVLIALVLALAVWVLLRYTSLGRYIFAIGSNEATARLCGIKVERTKLYLYSIAGLTAGLAGVMQFCRLTVGDPTTAMGAELDVIAAVVIGGGSLAGGEGSVFGSLVGALIMAFLRVGCDHVGVPSWVQEMIIGAVIVLAVTIDQMRRKSAT